MLLAGIDIGTLTCRLLIADVSPQGTLTVVKSDRQILRLGQGVDEGRRLSTAAMARVVKALSEWRTLIHLYPVTATVVVATSAVREATNRDHFMSWVARETGFDVEALSGEEEAQRTFLGIQVGLPRDVHRFLGLDIGGGSTEFMYVQENQQLRTFSFDLGVVRLTERLFQTDPPREEAVRAAERHVQAEIQTLRSALSDVAALTLVGTAGTVTTLAAMTQRLPHYEPTRIHNFRLDLKKIREAEKEIRTRTESERRQFVGLEEGREGVILAGTVILRTIMDTLGFEQCLVSDYGLREGMLVHYARQATGQ